MSTIDTESTECPHCGDLSEVSFEDIDLNDGDGEITVECDDCEKEFIISWMIRIQI